jgi:hypothetical protein
MHSYLKPEVSYCESWNELLQKAIINHPNQRVQILSFFLFSSFFKNHLLFLGWNHGLGRVYIKSMLKLSIVQNNLNLTRIFPDPPFFIRSDGICHGLLIKSARRHVHPQLFPVHLPETFRGEYKKETTGYHVALLADIWMNA